MYRKGINIRDPYILNGYAVSYFGIKPFHQNNIDNTRHSVERLVRITKEPTRINMVFKGSLPTRRAAMGAAMRPPAIRPAISKKGMLFKKIKKVMELANTTKNSARQTEPTT